MGAPMGNTNASGTHRGKGKRAKLKNPKAHSEYRKYLMKTHPYSFGKKK